MVAALFSLVCTGPVTAQDDSAEDIARKLANPNSTLAFLAFPIDYVQYDGTLEAASGQSAWRLSFQPSVPYPLAESVNFFVRPLVPLYFDQPVPVLQDGFFDDRFAARSGAFESTGLQLGDISFDVAIGKTFDSGAVLMGGMVGTLPTATDERVGLDQYLLGPEVFVGKGFNWGFAGILLNHQWNVGGEDAFDTSITAGQYFYTINLENAWQIQAQPTFSYNHEARDGNKWTVPLGIGIAKTLVSGGRPWKLALQYWHYVELPESFGPEFQLRFQFTPVMELPW